MTVRSAEPPDSPMAASGLSTAPGEPLVDGRGRGARTWLRWSWRTLTSMRTALLLLFLLAVAAVPGSVFPQRQTNAASVLMYLANDPEKGRILDRLGMFDVFGSAWFAAIYLLLFVSLAGCVLPRSLQHWRTIRSRPPATPRHLERLPDHRRLVTAASAEDVAVAASSHLRAARWRVDVRAGTVAAETGYSREVGNLLFHLALLGLLAAVAIGSLGGFRGHVVVRQGTSFAASTAQFDSFSPGRLFSASSLPPFSFTLERFSAEFQRGGQQNGAPRAFRAEVSLIEAPGEAPQARRIEVNEPLEVNGVKVFLVGHGYAPAITIRDKSGQVAFRDSVVCLPQDAGFTSTCVVKAPDASPQIGLTGFFLPTATVDPARGPYSSFPAPDDPALFLSAWEGDLGLDSGAPQSVYKLETSNMKRVGIKALRPGQQWTLLDGGIVTFDGYVRFASFAVARDPGKELALVMIVIAIAGLTLSLGVRRRRLWVRTTSGDSGVTVVDVAGISRSEHGSVASDLDRLIAALPPPVRDVETGGAASTTSRTSRS